MAEGPSNVLIVEDDPAISAPLRILFTSRGHRVQVTPTLAQAKARLDRNTQWVVLDLNLPDGMGEDLIEHARGSDLEPRIVVVTGVQERPRLEAMLQLKPHLALHKPIEFRDLLLAFESEPG